MCLKSQVEITQCQKLSREQLLGRSWLEFCNVYGLSHIYPL